jgi:hypothetical protein
MLKVVNIFLNKSHKITIYSFCSKLQQFLFVAQQVAASLAFAFAFAFAIRTSSIVHRLLRIFLQLAATGNFCLFQTSTKSKPPPSLSPLYALPSTLTTIPLPRHPQIFLSHPGEIWWVFSGPQNPRLSLNIRRLHDGFSHW